MTLNLPATQKHSNRPNGEKRRQHGNPNEERFFAGIPLEESPPGVQDSQYAEKHAGYYNIGFHWIWCITNYGSTDR